MSLHLNLREAKELYLRDSTNDAEPISPTPVMTRLCFRLAVSHVTELKDKFIVSVICFLSLVCGVSSLASVSCEDLEHCDF